MARLLPRLLLCVMIITACNRVDESAEAGPEEMLSDRCLRVEAGDPLFYRKGDTVYHDSLPFTGMLVEHYPGGQLMSVIAFANGQKHGMSKGFYENGRVKYTRPYHHGEKHGEHLGYYEDGTRKFRYYFENGFSQGHHQEWYESGQLYRDLNYVDGRERGPQKMFRPDGKLRGNYVVRENGRIYGLVGMKRCKNIDTENEKLDELLPD